MNFKTLDLNLLRVLDAMLREHSTTRAADRVGLSQPAVSAALNRLRAHLDDPLFVQEGQRLVPTPFAVSLEEPLAKALSSIETALSGNPDFNLSKCKRDFRIFGSDFFSEVLIPELAAEVIKTAPGVRLQLMQQDEAEIPHYLADGRLDIALLPPQSYPDWVEKAVAFHSTFVAVASTQNQRIAQAGIRPGQQIPLDLFCDLPQVMFSTEGTFNGLGDSHLKKLGRSRRLVMTAPVFHGVARAVSSSQFLAILPSRFAQLVAPRLDLEIYAVPHDIPMVRLEMYWHPRHSRDPAFLWLKDAILRHLAPIDELLHPISAAEVAAKCAVKRAERP